jgi:hypothetical protein
MGSFLLEYPDSTDAFNISTIFHISMHHPILSKSSFFLLPYERDTHLYLLISVIVIYNNMSLLLICKHIQVQNQLPIRLEI